MRPLRPLLGPILELALDGKTSDACAVVLFDADGQFRLVEQCGLPDSVARDPRAVELDGVLGRAWKTLKPASVERLGESAEDSALEKALHAEGFRRVSALPIWSDRRAIGLWVAAGRTEPRGGRARGRRKGSDARTELDEMASAAALTGAAIETVTRLERSRQRIAELETLQEVGRAVAQALDPHAVLALVVEDAAALLRAPIAGALLFRGRDDAVELAAGTATIQGQLGAQVAAGETLTGRALLTLRPQLENDPAHLPELRAIGGAAASLRRAVIAPFRIGAEPIGALFVGDTQPGRYRAGDATLLGALAEQAAIAIQNARLVVELERKRHESDRLRELARSLERLDLETLLGQVAAAARDLSGSQAALVALEHAGEGLRIEAIVGLAPETRGRRIPDPSGSRWVLDHGEPLVAEDARTDDRFDRSLGLPLGAACFLPIAGPERAVGVLVVGYDAPRRIPPPLVRLLEALAGHASAAIQNAQLFRAVELGKREWEEAFDAIGEGIARVDDEGRVARANQAFAYFVGKDVRSVIGVRLSELLVGRVAAGSVHPTALVEDALRSGRSAQAVCVFESPYRVLRVIGYPIPAGIALVFRDITAFATLEERHQRILEAVHDAVVITDLEGRLVYANPAAFSLFGYEARELLGRPIAELLPEEPDALAEMRRRWDETLKGRPQRYEIRIRRADGRIGTVEVSNAPLREADRAVGIVAVLRDISEHKEMQDRLVQTEKLAALGSLLSGVAHELNNPLASISSFAQLLDDPSAPDAQRDAAREIHTQAERAARIIQHLLTFARLREPRRETLDVAVVLDEVLALRQFDLGARAIDVRREYEPGLVVWGDRHALAQVFLNLILNAQQAMADRPGPNRLVVRAVRMAARIVIEVDDTGPGIPQEHLTRIFDPFFTTKPEGTGTGLGLSVSYGIVQEHGGEIAAVNRPEGGARLRVELPPKEAVGSDGPRESGLETAAPVESRAGGLRVLIIDDEPAIRRSLSTFLSRRGHRVDLAADGAEALEKLLHEEYDAVVCDIRMPGIGGMVLFQRLLAERPEVIRRIVFTTGDVVHEGTHSFLLESGRPYLMKPFELAELEERVQSVAAG